MGGRFNLPYDRSLVPCASSHLLRRCSQAFLLQAPKREDATAAESNGDTTPRQELRSEARRRVRAARAAQAAKEAAAADVAVWVAGSDEAAKHEPAFATPFEVLMRHVFKDPMTASTCPPALQTVARPYPSSAMR